MSDTQTVPTQIEALRELVQSEGWSLFAEMVRKEVTGDAFEDAVTKQLGVVDTEVAMARARQFVAVRSAGLKWLSWPQERLETLNRMVASAHESHVNSDNRRPRGL